MGANLGVPSLILRLEELVSLLLVIDMD